MHRKLKVFWLIVTLALVSTLTLPAATIPAVSADPDPVTSVTYKFYDFFQGKMDEEVWGRPYEEGGKPWIGRWDWYGTDYVESWSYPVVYQRGSPGWLPYPQESHVPPYDPYDDAAYWTNGRLNVDAENLPLNIDTVAWIDYWWLIGTGHRSFVPWDLTLGLGDYPGPGGYCNISWYMTYTSVERTNYWGWGPDRCSPLYWNYLNGAHDGWFVEINGTLTLDKLGAMKVFGMNGTTYDALPAMAAAWTAQEQPALQWWHWLESEGNWWPMVLPYAYNWLLHQTVVLGNDIYGKAKWLPYTIPPDWPWNLPGVVGIFDLSQYYTKGIVTVPIWITGWMLENLVGRWLSDWWSCMGGFMPFEGYYSDFHLDASIGPESTDLVLDTQVDWLLVAADGVGVPCSSAKWVFEPLWGDIPYATHTEENFQDEAIDYTWSSGWHYYKNSTGWRKSYFTSTVGAFNYGGQNPYGYTPSAWNLGIDGKALAPWRPWNDPYHQRYYFDVGPGNHSGWIETLIFDWSEIQHKGKVPGFHQDPWTVRPSYNVSTVWGNLVLDQALSEPLTEHPGKVFITEKTLTFIGPIDFAQWSSNVHAANWTRLATNDRWPNCSGILPWGSPIIYWSIGQEIPICNPAIASTHKSKPVWTTNTRTSNKDYKYGLSWQYKGVTININAIVKNRGTVPCNFTVTASIETAPGVWTVIGSQPVINLPPCNELPLVFPWDTSTADHCKTYRIKIEIIEVLCIPPEDYLKDNVYILDWTYFTPSTYPKLWFGPDWSCMTTTGGAVYLKMVGDVDGDGVVGSKDNGKLGAAYGSRPGQAAWNPEADFDNDGVVGSKDNGKLGANYGKRC